MYYKFIRKYNLLSFEFICQQQKQRKFSNSEKRSTPDSKPLKNNQFKAWSSQKSRKNKNNTLAGILPLEILHCKAIINNPPYQKKRKSFMFPLLMGLNSLLIVFNFISMKNSTMFRLRISRLRILVPQPSIINGCSKTHQNSTKAQSKIQSRSFIATIHPMLLSLAKKLLFLSVFYHKFLVYLLNNANLYASHLS